MDNDLQRLLAEAERIRTEFHSVEVVTLAQVIISLIEEVQRLREKDGEPGGELEHT